MLLCRRRMYRDDVLENSVRVREWRHKNFGKPASRFSQVPSILENTRRNVLHPLTIVKW